MPRSRIVLATIGSLGDLHPVIAIALALRERGADPVLAVPEDHLPKCRAAGIEAAAILPTFVEVGRTTGLSDDEVVARILADNHFLLGRILLPPPGDSVDRLLRIADGADAVVGSAFTFAAPIAAERLAMPYVHTVLQPMSWFSALDPPTGPSFHLAARPPVGRSGARWNAVVLSAGKRYMRGRYGRAVNRVRRAHGLPPSRAAPLIEAGTRPVLSIGTYSPALAPLPADVAGAAEVTGFPWFDRVDGATPTLDTTLVRFLAAGPPPLVVSLGSFVPYSATRFYQRSAAVAARLGLRAVLLVGEAAVTGSPDVLVLPYAPHSLLFPHASAIVHHGGIGTTGQALRSGRPQLVVPFMGDQFDNAARIERLGVGLWFPEGNDDAALARALKRLLAEPRIADRARDLGARVAAENESANAADAILRAILPGQTVGNRTFPGEEGGKPVPITGS